MSIKVSNLSFSYGSRLILDDVNFEVKDNQFLSILGPNGVGKSTLFRCILGLLPGYTGEILVDGKSTRDIGIKRMAELIAHVPQQHNPAFNFSVYDMVLMGTSVQVSSVSTPGRKQMIMADAALERVGILHLKDRGFNQISGGERQLVLIARALVQQAKILIFDEPTANLDFGNQVRIMNRMKELAGEGYTIIQSTHNPDQTFLFSDAVMAMKDGKVLNYGDPKNVFTSELINTLYGVDVKIEHLYGDKARVCIPLVALK